MNMMNKIDRVEQIKEARKQILELPKDRMVSDVQAPSPFTNIPSRAFSDKYILAQPATLIVLGVICSYCNGQSGIAYPNQLTVAKRLNRTQQAVSKHFRKLVAWGYIEKVRKENPLRVRGPKGASWRVIYEPGIDQDELAQITTDPRVEANKAEDTMKQIVKEQVKEEKKQARLSEAQTKLADSIAKRYIDSEREYFPYDSVFNAVCKYLAGEQTIDAWNKLGTGLQSPIERGYLTGNNTQRMVVNKDINTQRMVVSSDNAVHKKQPPEVVQQVQISQPLEVVQNSNNITIDNNINEISKEMVKVYSHMLDQIMGTRGSWRWDMRQEAMAEDIARMGVSLDQFTKTVERVLKHKRKEGIQPPYTMAYFKSVFTDNKEATDVKDITKSLARSFKL